ncbi:MAG: hypothetical protein U1D30_13825 [Planctomycetota bacterium]
MTGTMYWADPMGDTIWQRDSNGFVTAFQSGLADPIALAIDDVQHKLYWIDDGTHKIQRSNLDGTGIEDFATGLQYPSALAIDAVTGIVYWTDDNTIQKRSRSGGLTQALPLSLGAPRALAWDGYSGQLYFSDSSAIYSWTPGATQAQIVASSGVGNPRQFSIAMNLPLGIHRLFWTDDANNRIHQLDLDTGATTVLASTGSAVAMGIVADPDNDRFYWSTYSGSLIGGTIIRASLPRPTEAQDHEHSETAYVHPDGSPNIAGFPLSATTGQTMTVQEFTEARWQPQWNALSIANGNFSYPGEATDLIHVGHVMVPGWSHHGGGGEGEIVGNSSDGYHLLLSDDGISRTHNLVYVPYSAKYLTFKAKRAEADSNDVLMVEFGNRYSTTMTEIGRLSANVTDTGYQTYSVEIPVGLRDQVHNIRFQLADSQGGWIDAEVQIDDIRFTQSAIGKIINGVTSGGQLAGTSSQAEYGFASVLPLLGANLGSKLGLGNALASTFALPDVSNVTSMAELRLLLETAGFTVHSMLTDAELDALPVEQFADYFHVSRSTTQHLSSQSALDMSAIESIAGLAGITVSGNLTLEADVTFHYSFGVDSNGFYLQPGNLIEAEIHIGGTATGDLGIFGNVTATPDMDLVATLNLSATAVDGRIRVEDLVNDFGEHASFSITEVTPDTDPDLTMRYELGEFLNVPIVFYSTHEWNITSSGVTYAGTNWNDSAIRDSVAAMVQGGLDRIEDYARQFANVVENTPFIGEALADALGDQISAGLSFTPNAALANSSFSATSLIAAALDGTLADVPVLEFTYNVHSADTFSTGDMPSVNFGWDAAGVEIGLTLGSSGLTVTPDLDFHVVFGLDLGRGLYIREARPSKARSRWLVN